MDELMEWNQQWNGNHMTNLIHKGYYKCKRKYIQIIIIKHYDDFILIIITEYKNKTYFLLLLLSLK